MTRGQDLPAMGGLLGDELLALPVRLHGIQLGRPADVLIDRVELKAIGMEVLCGDDEHRFLAFPAAIVTDEEIGIRSPLLLLEEDALAFYRKRTVGLASLRGQLVRRRGHKIGALDDVVVDRDGSLREIVLVGGARIPFDEDVRFIPRTRSAA